MGSGPRSDSPTRQLAEQPKGLREADADPAEYGAVQPALKMLLRSVRGETTILHCGMKHGIWALGLALFGGLSNARAAETVAPSTTPSSEVEPQHPAAAPAPAAASAAAPSTPVPGPPPRSFQPAPLEGNPLDARPLPIPPLIAPNAKWQPPPGPRWYGWQTLAFDAAAITLVFGALALQEDEASPLIGVLGAATYGIGAPVVHAVHGNYGRAFGSLGIRVLAPIAIGLIGMQLEDCSQGEFLCGAAGLVIGGLVGISGAIAVDAAALAYTTPRDPSLSASSTFLVSPYFLRGQLGLRAIGAF